MELPIRCTAETFDEFGYRSFAQRSGRSVEGTIRPDPAAENLPEHRKLPRLSSLNQMAKNVSDAPASTP